MLSDNIMAEDSVILDYDEEENDATVDASAGDAPAKKDVKGTYVSIHSSGFRDFLLKPELLRAIVDCGFEHPSEGERVALCCYCNPLVIDAFKFYYNYFYKT